MHASVVSDIHLEYYKNVTLNNTEGSDLLILAGDIGCGISSVLDLFIKDCCKKYNNVIYILGNHEFYGFDITDVVNHWNEMSRDIENLHFLNNSTCVIGGVKFIGSTLFSDTVNGLSITEELFINGLNRREISVFNDFNHIYLNGRKITLNDYNVEYTKSIDFITREINRPSDLKKVLITHYGTMMPSIEDRFMGNPSRPLFVTDLSSLICNSDLDLVIHGHLHTPSDYEYFGKRVICHPYGYDQDDSFLVKQVKI